MLPSTPLSKVYGQGHIKKFWLLQSQKEAENKSLLSSSTSRNSGNSSGIGHESKQGTQFSLGNTSTRMLAPSSGLVVRPLVSGPACFNMAVARQTSLVSCAESLSPPVQMEQSQSLAWSSSPSLSASTLKEENCYPDAGAKPLGLKSPCQEDANSNSISSSVWGSSFGYRDQSNGDLNSPITSKESGFHELHECFPSIKDSRQDEAVLQDGYQNGKVSDDISLKADNSGFSKCSLGFFSKLETTTPFAVPFQLPKKYLLEAGAKRFIEEASKVGSTSGNLHSNRSVLPSDSKSEQGRGTLFKTVEGGPVKEHGICCTVMRTCSVCGTSKTPLWRSGPRGPKSLCNACGIRFKKAKRGSSEGVGCLNTTTSSASPPKASLKPVKRKQDTPVTVDPYHAKPFAMNGLTSQLVKKRRWLQPISNGEWANHNCEVTGSSNESSLTWNLHSPSAVSSPSVSHFERLSIAENSSTLDAGGETDAEEAAVLLMYMSCGFVFV